MNITQDCGNEDAGKIVRAVFSIKSGFYFANGNESFYKFIGRNSCFTMTELLHPDDLKDFKDAVENIMRKPQQLIVRMKCFDGAYRWLHMTMYENGRVMPDGFRSFDVNMLDIANAADEKNCEQRHEAKFDEALSLSNSSSYEFTLDPGTGLMNKRAITEYTMEMVEKCSTSMYIAITDIDDFKSINDRYGHLYGDEVLSKVAEIFRKVTLPHGAVGRFGGDEFLMCFESAEDEETLRRILKTIMKNIMWEYSMSDNNFMPTLSTGVARYPDDGTDYEELFKKADKCLYIAKAKGKNRFIIYDEKKHGPVQMLDGHYCGNMTAATYEKKTEAVYGIIKDVMQNGMNAVNRSLKTVCQYFDIDAAGVFCGEGLHKEYSFGRYVNEIKDMSFAQDAAYLSLFDENGIYSESTITRLDGKFSPIYRLYRDQENGKFIQCADIYEGRIRAAVSFDFFNRSPKYGESDMSLITLAGRIIAYAANLH